MTAKTVLSSLEGRVAVVTGASGGLGAHTAEVLASRGAKVALLARSTDKLEDLAKRITADGGTALAVTCDVTDPEAVARAAAQVRAELGRPDLVFNNAGIMLPAPVTEHRTDQWQQQVDLNVTAALTTLDVFVDDLVAAAAAGGPADLINTSSIAAQYLFPTFAVYGATKAFVSHLTRHLRTELGPKDVRVSALEPGIVGTDLWDKVTDQGAKDWYAGAQGDIEFLRPQDIAEIVAFTAALPRHVNLQQVTVMPTRQG
ncbi:SDR family oxidoreductase [Streptomyces sp. NPDC004542]|uniref:SDR family oxidoreductase n=1 Tax=Streptomyces sp. NPDC004542 TaxID=3154281 RepID=UPI0033B86763